MGHCYVHFAFVFTLSEEESAGRMELVEKNVKSDLRQANEREGVVVVNLYSHSQCMQHVLHNHVRIGKKLKVNSKVKKKNNNEKKDNSLTIVIHILCASPA